MSEDIAFTKETVQLFTENCKQLNDEYYHNCDCMKDNCEWIAEQFDQLFKDKFQITPLTVQVEKRGMEIIVKTGLSTISQFSTKIFEELGIDVGIMVNFNNEIDFMFFLDIGKK